ncbi:MAG TPA: cytochrome c biogenesis protein CcdA, partial [Planctomycetaceae bacterium]|nr:cytochrome c biogenesis protein CcdA [Planctomycetaceae bacterium]
KGSADPIQYSARLTPTNAAKGDMVTLSITAKLRSGWHTYSLTQKDIGGEPTEIDVASVQNLEAIDAEFTPSQPPKKETGDMGNVLETYHDEVTWTRTYRVTGEKPGDYGVSAEISYQLCDARQCLPVNVVPLVLGQIAEEAPSPFAQVAGEEAPSPFAAAPPDENGPPKPANDPVIADAKPAAKPNDVALMPFNLFILTCIAGGFAALLTPCSYPMVPITVSFFLKQSEKEHKRPTLLAIVYCGTIILAFTVIGVVLSFFFGATFANDLANNAPLNWFFGAILVAFALNMLGAFEIRVPSSLLNWTSSRGGSGGYVGAIFMALTFTLTSFTCTFAILGGLITQASDGHLLRPTLGMLAFGTAFASPFFILALLPQMLKKMPKSGGWMNTVKVVLGLIEMGAAVKFFSIADNPNPILFDYVTVMIIWTVLALAIGLYMLGFFRFEHDSPEGPIPLGSALTSMAALVLAGMLGYLTVYPERATGVLMENIVSFAPPMFNIQAAAPMMANGPARAADNQPAVEHHGLRFVMDYHHAFEVARRERRPVMLDFTGVNCVNCRKMERVMGRPENHERLQKFITAALFVDIIPKIQDADVARQMLLDNRALQDKLLSDSSMPNYAIVAPDGETVLATHIGYNEGDEFTKFLDAGWQNWQTRTQTASR